jgi:hypothetical protein
LDRPTATALPLTLIAAGIVAVVLGSHASKAFDNLGGALLVRFLGVVLLLGGLVVVTGIIRSDPALEPIGLTLIAAGLAFYGVGVALGLGTQGLIAGLIAVGSAVGFLGRIRLLIREAPSRE